MKRGLSWADTQTVTLDQAVFILTGDQGSRHEAEDKKADAQVVWLKKIAMKCGRTLAELAAMGPVGLADFIKTRTGKAVRPDVLHPLLQDSDFQ